MTEPRFTVTRHHGGHVWHVIDRARQTLDIVAFRPDAAPPIAQPLVVATVALEHATAPVLAAVEWDAAFRVGLALPSPASSCLR